MCVCVGVYMCVRVCEWILYKVINNMFLTGFVFGIGNFGIGNSYDKFGTASCL